MRIPKPKPRFEFQTTRLCEAIRAAKIDPRTKGFRAMVREETGRNRLPWASPVEMERVCARLLQRG